MSRLINHTWLLPDRALVFLLSKMTGRASPRFGLREAICYSWRIDQWTRYAPVAELIGEGDTVLDVGGGNGLISEFIRNPVTILDVDPEGIKFAKKRKLHAILGSGCAIPFPDNSFDIVTSVESLEHVPERDKYAYCCELKRVARKRVILHAPADSADGKYRGTEYGLKFNDWYRKRFGKDEFQFSQHLTAKLPTIERLSQYFPNAEVIGQQNTRVWLKYLIMDYVPYKRFLAGLILKVKDIKDYHSEPYHACLIVWDKPPGSQ